MSTLEIAKLRSRKSRRSTIGSFTRSSHHKTASSAAAEIAADEAITLEPNQSSSCPLSSTTCRKPRPTVSKPMPT